MKKILLSQSMFSNLPNLRIRLPEPPEKVKSNPFTHGKSIQLYTKTELCMKNEGKSIRTNWFEKQLYAIWKVTGQPVPYAFRTADTDDTPRSLDAGCLGFLFHRSSPEIELICNPETDVIEAVLPIGALVDRYSGLEEKLISQLDVVAPERPIANDGLWRSIWTFHKDGKKQFPVLDQQGKLKFVFKFKNELDVEERVTIGEFKKRLAAGEFNQGGGLRMRRVQDSGSENIYSIRNCINKGCADAEILKSWPSPPKKKNTSWNKLEIRSVVDVYFKMLGLEAAGKPLTKSEFRRKLLTRLERSSGAIEMKMQNISAVLAEQGVPWIRGYKPLGNYQNDLLEVVSAVFEENCSGITFDHLFEQLKPESISEIFVGPPKASQAGTSSKQHSRSPSIKNFVQQNIENKKLGDAGEEFVLDLERSRLVKLGRADLANRVEWAARTQGDGLGYDIVSFDKEGSPIYIEVKTTCGVISSDFFLSATELAVSQQHGEAYKLYRVFQFANNAKVYVVNGPLNKKLQLKPTEYRAWI